MYLAISRHQDVCDVENWKKAEAFTKERIQSGALIIAGALYNDMKTELFISKMHLFSFDICLGQIQLDFSQEWQGARVKHEKQSCPVFFFFSTPNDDKHSKEGLS